MLPNPLHPAVVHFPVVLAFLLPFFAVGAIWAIGRGSNARRAWLIPLAGAVTLTVSSWAAVGTGSTAGEKVERVVSEQVVESHEELAEAFLAASAGVAVVALAGLLGGISGRAARVITAVGSLALVGLVARVGHSGGQLVYRYGAAAAYTGQSSAASGEVTAEQTSPHRADRREEGSLPRRAASDR